MTTHYDGCYDSGPRHYECALLEVKRLRGRRTMDKYENIETVKRLDFDRLDTLVSERIGALKLLAQGMTEREVNDEICRDLILPCVYTLTQFLESVDIDNEEKNGG